MRRNFREIFLDIYSYNRPQQATGKIFDEREYTKEDYADGSTRLLDRMEEQ
ncbi:hypothetical protein BDV96DRAFT_655750 [Lophiotrema nucula]|uniref:Uncharacterized protein n=1 Tax=Lophiotrema nucula TaxID=690887 RepID=A0A6A5YDW0_9PLEO|nr:hypothetical protein BDV96DRAFT_655750 [Lophiotrema nucula]